MVLTSQEAGNYFQAMQYTEPFDTGKEDEKRSYSCGVKFKGEVDLGFALEDWQHSGEDQRVSKYRVGQKVHSGYLMANLNEHFGQPNILAYLHIGSATPMLSNFELDIKSPLSQFPGQ